MKNILFSLVLFCSGGAFAQSLDNCDRERVLERIRADLTATITYCSKLDWDPESLRLNCTKWPILECRANFNTRRGTAFHLSRHIVGGKVFRVSTVVDGGYDDEGNEIPPQSRCEDPYYGDYVESVNSATGRAIGHACAPRPSWP